MTAHVPPPALRIVRGDPTPEEIAALVAVLSALSAVEEPEEAVGQPPSEWGSPIRAMRQPIAPSGWWGSALPR